MTSPSPKAASASNPFDHMETLVAIGLLDQKTLDAAKAKAGVPTNAPASDLQKGAKSSQDLKKLSKGKSTQKALPDNIGVGKGKFVMTSDERVKALNHGSRTYSSEGRFFRVPNFFSDQKFKVKGGEIAYQPSVPKVRYERSDVDPTRAAGKQDSKPKVPQPSINYQDATRAARFSK